MSSFQIFHRNIGDIHDGIIMLIQISGCFPNFIKKSGKQIGGGLIVLSWPEAKIYWNWEGEFMEGGDKVDIHVVLGIIASTGTGRPLRFP